MLEMKCQQVLRSFQVMQASKSHSNGTTDLKKFIFLVNSGTLTHLFYSWLHFSLLCLYLSFIFEILSAFNVFKLLKLLLLHKKDSFGTVFVSYFNFTINSHSNYFQKISKRCLIISVKIL